MFIFFQQPTHKSAVAKHPWMTKDGKLDKQTLKCDMHTLLAREINIANADSYKCATNTDIIAAEIALMLTVTAPMGVG